jgi:hypothetical protein
MRTIRTWLALRQEGEGCRWGRWLAAGPEPGRSDRFGTSRARNDREGPVVAVWTQCCPPNTDAARRPMDTSRVVEGRACPMRPAMVPAERPTWARMVAGGLAGHVAGDPLAAAPAGPRSRIVRVRTATTR